MKSELLSLLSFAIGIAAYSCSQLFQHSKLKGQKGDDSFFGEESHWRKWANPLQPPKDSLYYRLFNIGYRERFLFSSTLLVWTTDFYHLMQFLFFLFISLSVVPILGWTYGIAFWIVAHLTHFILYRTLQR